MNYPPVSLSLFSPLAPSHLKRFLAGDPTARRLLPQFIHRQLMLMARKLAPELPGDLHGEVVSELWVLLLSAPPKFSEAGSVYYFFRFSMLNALKPVRASYSAVGSPRRYRGEGLPEPVSDIGLEATDVSELAEVGAVERIEAKVIVGQVLADAPTTVKAGLVLVHMHGVTITDAAATIGVSRFALVRSMDRFIAACAG